MLPVLFHPGTFTAGWGRRVLLTAGVWSALFFPMLAFSAEPASISRTASLPEPVPLTEVKSPSLHLSRPVPALGGDPSAVAQRTVLEFDPTVLQSRELQVADLVQKVSQNRSLDPTAAANWLRNWLVTASVEKSKPTRLKCQVTDQKLELTGSVKECRQVERLLKLAREDNFRFCDVMIQLRAIRSEEPVLQSLVAKFLPEEPAVATSHPIRQVSATQSPTIPRSKFLALLETRQTNELLVTAQRESRISVENLARITIANGHQASWTIGRGRTVEFGQQLDANGEFTSLIRQEGEELSVRVVCIGNQIRLQDCLLEARAFGESQVVLVNGTDGSLAPATAPEGIRISRLNTNFQLQEGQTLVMLGPAGTGTANPLAQLLLLDVRPVDNR